MKFTLDIEVDAKRASSDVLNDLIERACIALMKPSAVKVVDIRGREIGDDDTTS